MIVLAICFAWREVLRGPEIYARCNLSAGLRSTPAGLPSDLQSFDAQALMDNVPAQFYHSSRVGPMDTGFVGHRTV